ncbi:MAG TPA: uroporphyrinogen decarboxylase family protein [Clostridiales bacterium]|nr:uroporphyrinogen decarboxylase family protein [Clostridiales bacterium]
MMSLFKHDFSRLKKVLLREGEPDRVPFFEIIVDGKVIEYLTGKAPSISVNAEFYIKHGYDYVMSSFGIPYRMEKLPAADTSLELTKERRMFINEQKGIIGNRYEFDTYKWPVVDTEILHKIKKTIEILPDKMKTVILAGDGILESAMALMGYTQLSFMIYDDPLLINNLFEKLGKDLLKAFELCMKNVNVKSIGAIVIGDDLGFNTSTIISPDDIRKYIFPWHKKIVELAHRYDLPVILHSCGKLDEIMEDIIDIGYNAKHSFEDNILPVTEAKKKYGDRIAIMGGVDINVLSTATEKETRQYVENILDKCMPGGGYALGSGNSITNYISVKNYLAMLDEGRKKGVY